MDRPRKAGGDWRCRGLVMPLLRSTRWTSRPARASLVTFLQPAAAAVDGKGFVLLEAGIGETHQPGRNLVGGRRARPRYRGCGQGRFSGSLMVPGSLTPRDRRARFACVSPIPPRWRPYRTRHCPCWAVPGCEDRASRNSALQIGLGLVRTSPNFPRGYAGRVSNSIPYPFIG